MSESVHHPDGHVEGALPTPLVPEQELPLARPGRATGVPDVAETTHQPVAGDSDGENKAAEAELNTPDDVKAMQPVDVERRPAERVGVHTGLNREELLATLAIRRRVRDMRLTRLGRVGPDVDRGGPARRRRLRG